MTLRTLDDAALIRAAVGHSRRLTIIGGGFIGLALAASARRLGSEVTVTEAHPRLLTRGVPTEIAAALQLSHGEAGVASILVSGSRHSARGGVRLAERMIALHLSPDPAALASEPDLNGLSVRRRRQPPPLPSG